jgi:hypothetical protein
MNDKKEGSPTPGAREPANPTKRRGTSVSKALAKLEFAEAAEHATDYAAILSVDAALGRIMHRLVPVAEKKARRNDYTLLRLLLKYSQQANRRLNADRRSRGAR